MKNKRNIIIIMPLLLLPVIICIHAISENVQYYKAISYVRNGDYESADAIKIARPIAK